MNADIQGALDQLNRSYPAFTHRGRFLSKRNVKRVLEYGISKGYKTTSELSDAEVDKILGWIIEVK
jgi:hypothetical protein